MTARTYAATRPLALVPTPPASKPRPTVTRTAAGDAWLERIERAQAGVSLWSPPPGVAACVRRIARECCVETDDVLGRARSKWIVRARHRVWSVVRDTLDLPYQEIGRIFGVDHTTVLDGVRKHRVRESK